MGEENDDEIPDLFSGIEDSDGSLSSESALKPVDRARGILSPTDRDYLCGLKDYSHSQTELNRRQEIRERTIEGIRDFNLLWLLLEEPEWKKVIEAFEAEELNTALSSMIAFAYTAIGQDTSRMEDILERALYEGANYDMSGRWSGKANDATVDIDIDYEPNVEELYTRVQQGEGDNLTPAEIGALVQAGKLDPDDLEKLENTGPDFPGVYAGGAIERTDETDTEE
ncbi:hypothetical protein [Haloarcula onubensis]|uniref:Domain of unknown function domain-containing protein n=1 Tax=Haloarcula onubensis TaxID=2950539 RepID=A0ABU2FRV1_9EURY|nr:hypothetical protein [Halomicroarcula sp. S3CR25-11]MDS0283493.1 hypothetical protein [Halomicroarcula sp. S3CR25-11]